jgi:hypothetical protein
MAFDSEAQVDVAKLSERMKARGRGADVRAVAHQHRDLRAGRPDSPPDARGLPCERCGAETAAEDPRLLYGELMLCQACERFHLGVIHQRRAMQHAAGVQK